MDYELNKKISNCKNQIKENNRIIASLSKKNVRLFDSLMIMTSVISPSKKERYDKELASDNWKKTDYYTTRNSISKINNYGKMS